MASKLNILAVDDDELYRAQIELILKDFGNLTTCSSQAEAFEALESQQFDLAIIDLNLPDELAGFKVLAKAKLQNAHVIVLSSEDAEEIFEDAYKLGCDHYLAKKNFHITLKEYVERFAKSNRSQMLSDFLENDYFTKDEELINHLTNLTKLNLKEINLFLSGPTGCGKTYLAKFIHRIARGDNSPFIALNCSEITESLLESELFGHVKGAFTGATENKKGKLLLANNGTLFLDEITTMPMAMQQKLLKAIDEKEFYPVGASKPVKSNFSIITATCEDIIQKIQANEFRKDLFFRVNGHHIEIKGLIERKNDVEHIIKRWMKNSSRKFVIKESAIEKLSLYPWPGNIRELKKVFTLMQHSENGIIEASDLPNHIRNNQSLFMGEDHSLTQTQKDFILNYGLRKFIDSIENQIVKELYDQNDGKVTHCIKQLRISNSAFYRILGKSLQ